MSYQKITVGFVVQVFDDKGNPINQEFIASDDCRYERTQGEPIDAPENDTYLPFNMVQPPKSTKHF